jgi:prepilin peptidase CpaA
MMIRTQADTILAIGLPVPNSILMAKKIPYGIAIAIGGFLAFPSSPLFMTALQGLK